MDYVTIADRKRVKLREAEATLNIVALALLSLMIVFAGVIIWASF